MDGYKTVTVSNLRASRSSQVAEINISANVYGNHWSSGTGRFDDFSVSSTTHPVLWNWQFRNGFAGHRGNGSAVAAFQRQATVRKHEGREQGAVAP